MPLRWCLLDADLKGHSGKITEMLASEIKTLAFMESFHRPGGITTSDLQRQLCLPSLITLHTAVKARRREVSPTAA